MKKSEKPKNYKAHIAIFVLAFIFWFMVKMNKPYDYTVAIPLHVINNNSETWLKYPAPEDVRVEFSGRGIDLLRLGFYNTAYEIDLSAETQKFSFNLTEHREYVRKPQSIDVEVKSIVSPIELAFDIDQRRERKIPVNVNADVKTQNGFICVNKVADPESIMVIGPASFMDTLSVIQTETKSYQNINLAFDDRFSIRKSEEFFGEYQPHRLKVFFDVQRLAEKEIVEVPVKVENVPDNYQVIPLPSRVLVYVKGGEKVLAEADKTHFNVIIDFQKDWQPGARRVNARATTDLNVSYLEIRPQSFELIVQKRNR